MKNYATKTRKILSYVLGILLVLCLTASAVCAVPTAAEEGNQPAFTKVAWYEFDDADNLGKDTLGVNNLVPKGVSLDAINGGIALKDNGLLYAPALGEVDGDNNYVDFSDNLTGSFSISMRLYLRSAGGGGNYIVSTGSYGSNFHMSWGYDIIGLNMGNNQSKDFKIGLTSEFAWFRLNVIYNESDLSVKVVSYKEGTTDKFEETWTLTNPALFGGNSKYSFTVGAQSHLGGWDDCHASCDEDKSIYPNVSDLRVYSGAIDEAEIADILQYDQDKLNQQEKPTFEVKPISAWNFADSLKDVYGHNDLTADGNYTLENGTIKLEEGAYLYANKLAKNGENFTDVSDYLSAMTISLKIKTAKGAANELRTIFSTGSWGGAFSAFKNGSLLQLYYGGNHMDFNVFGDAEEWYTFIFTADTETNTAKAYMAKGDAKEATLFGNSTTTENASGNVVIKADNYGLAFGAWTNFGQATDKLFGATTLADVKMYDFAFTQEQANQLINESETVKVVGYESEIIKVGDVSYSGEILSTATENEILAAGLPETVQVTNANNNVITANIVWTKVEKGDYTAVVKGFLTGKAINNNKNLSVSIEIPYVASEEDQMDIKPLVWYEFNDGNNLGKDSMGNFDLKLGGNNKVDWNKDGYVTFTRANESYLYAPALSENSTLNFSQLMKGGYTVSIKINADNTIGDGSYYLLSTGAYGEAFLIYGCYNQYELRYTTGEGDRSATVKTGSLKDTWATLTITMDQNTGILAYYLNGEMLGSKKVDNYKSFAGDGLYTFTLGGQAASNNTCGTQYFEGSVADLKVYDFALSSRNVADLYANENTDTPLASSVSYRTVKEINVDLTDVDVVMSEDNTSGDVLAQLPATVTVVDNFGDTQECSVEWLGRKGGKILGYVKGCKVANAKGLMAEVNLKYKIDLLSIENGNLTEFTVDGESYDKAATYAVGEDKIVRFKANANDYYELNYVTVNNEKLVADENGVFTFTASDYSVINAVFSAKKYTITYVLNNGEDNEVVEYTYGEEKQLDTYFTKDGYTFDGWYLNEDLSGEKVTEIDSQNPANIVLYAKWKESQQTPDTDSGSTSGSTTVKPAKGCKSSLGGGSVLALGAIAAVIMAVRKKRED